MLRAGLRQIRCGFILFLACMYQKPLGKLFGNYVYSLSLIITTCNFSKATEVLSLHFQIEALSLWISCVGY